MWWWVVDQPGAQRIDRAAVLIVFCHRRVRSQGSEQLADQVVAEAVVRLAVDQLPAGAGVEAARVQQAALGPQAHLAVAGLAGDGQAFAVDVQRTLRVRSAVLPLRKRPMAVNCWLSPSAMLGAAGVTSIDCSHLMLES